MAVPAAATANTTAPDAPLEGATNQPSLKNEDHCDALSTFSTRSTVIRRPTHSGLEQQLRWGETAISIANQEWAEYKGEAMSVGKMKAAYEESDNGTQYSISVRLLVDFTEPYCLKIGENTIRY